MGQQMLSKNSLFLAYMHACSFEHPSLNSYTLQLHGTQQVMSKADGGEAHENGAAAGGADKDEGGGKAEEEEGGAKDVKASVANVVQALTELVSVQTPASVWLPNKHLTLQHSGKVLIFLISSEVVKSMYS